ncbi:hypothetical protein K431DRAFT_285264 [Polychaeton citri CBS 116435]|uniref:Uncharacterized protein n=1 Tax=Polychaeton citri CBS 116435 TaxID=1314669 RepID=A0A9P4UQ13_9PEZI|nr:hypothetical protein K431DRAFT_285264 [Polychaeton citri CBS 116435]
MRQHGFEYWGFNASRTERPSLIEAFVPVFSTGGSSTLLQIDPTTMVMGSAYFPTSTSTVWTTLVSTRFITIRPTPIGSSSGTGLEESSTPSLPAIPSFPVSASPPFSSKSISTAPSLLSTPYQTSLIHTGQTTSSPTSSPSATAAVGAVTDNSQVQKHAVIGGLSGAIAGLALVGLLIFLLLRKRRRKSGYPTSDDENEKALRPTLAQKWSELSIGVRRPEASLQPSRDRVPTVDGHLIRVSQNRWPRPFIGSEGLRESMGPQQLHVTNPDPSRSGTPASLVTPAPVLPWQRPSLAAALFRPRSGSRTSSRSRISRGFHELPTITVEPALSRECILSNRPPSVHSYASCSTSPVVTHQPPEDPFVTPPEEEPPNLSQYRPALMPLQSGRPMMTSMGDRLRPSHAKQAQLMPTARIVSSSSASTVSSSWPSTRTRSDPFDLDERHADRGMADDGCGGQSRTRGQTPNWMLYEGT